MFEPIRGGTRGGQAEFKWSDVSADKDRENYLGHSINAPTGRWQKNKDVHWYNRDSNDGEAERLAEIKKIKEAEADALSVALGFGPTKRDADSEQAVASSSAAVKADDPIIEQQREEKRRLKEEKRARKEEKRVRKEAKKAMKARESMEDERYGSRRRDHSRSRSPRPRSPRRTHHESDDRRRPRSITPPWRDQHSPPHQTSGRERGRRDDYSPDRRSRFDERRH